MNYLIRNAVPALAGIIILPIVAAENIYDFEKSLDGWRSNSSSDKVMLSKDFPIEGKQSLLFTAPKWDGAKPVWPAFETRMIPTRDWRKHDRLAVTVYNNTPEEARIGFWITDSKTPLRKGVKLQSMKIPPFAARVIVQTLHPGKIEKKIDFADISVLHLFTENPRDGMQFYIDNITLLEPGDPVPTICQAFKQKIRQQQRKKFGFRLNQLEKKIAELRLDDDRFPPGGVAYLINALKIFKERLYSGDFNAFLAGVVKKDILEWRSIQAVAKVMQNSKMKHSGDERILVGYASSTLKVLPEVPVFEPLPPVIALQAARNEKEAFQLVVLPLEYDCKKVGITLGTFRGTAGTLPASALSVVPVGFVETTFAPASGSEHVGYWPDPLLSFLPKVDVKANKAQPFWVKVSIPANQKPGVYIGNAGITVDNKTIASIPVSIRVYNFVLPDKEPLPLAITFCPRFSRPSCDPRYDSLERSKESAPVHAWKRHKNEWNEMLSEYYLKFDSLYNYGSDYMNYDDILNAAFEQKKRGKLVSFNLGNFWQSVTNDPDRNYGMRDFINIIRPRYEKAGKLGLLSHAYIYGCDEVEPKNFAKANRAAAILKREFPDVPFFTTAYDNTYGMDGRLNSYDWFCPKTDKYDMKQALLARKAGKQVWWYICNFPVQPYANNFVESPGLDIRLLMGAMTAKYRPDGFLYYQTAIWHTFPITAGPYTDWNAHSHPGRNGDGNWTYPGPDGTPLASIRLENFRDGLEDYAYVKILEEKLSKADPKSQWAANTRAALKVPKELVADLKNYANDPQHLYVWRSRLAELIESAPAD